MSAYALAHLRHVDPHPDVLEYMEKIQGTLDPFSGRFIVHRARRSVMSSVSANRVGDCMTDPVLRLLCIDTRTIVA